MERLAFRSEGYKFWTWRGHKIHYVEQGEGVPIVLIHGFGASAFHWSDDDDDEEEEDDSEALMAELERIKKERAEERHRKERQQQEEDLKVKEAELIRGNPLLNNATSFNVKKRWDDDVVFKNQTRGETKVAKRFINDTIKNDFHRKFLQKYMK